MSERQFSCLEVEPLLDAFHDGELEGADKRLVEAHLAGCGACRERLVLIGQLVTTLRALPVLKPPRDIADEIPAIIEKRRRSTARVVVPLAWGSLAVAAAAAVVFIAFRPLSGTNHGPVVAETHRVGPGAMPGARPAAVQAGREEVAVAPQGEEPRRGPGERAAAPHHHGGRERASLSPAKEELASKTASSRPAGRGGPGEPTVVADNGELARQDFDRGASVEVATLGEIGHSACGEAIGLSTGEDGLYDIRM